MQFTFNRYNRSKLGVFFMEFAYEMHLLRCTRVWCIGPLVHLLYWCIICEINQFFSMKCSTKCVPWNMFCKVFHKMCSTKYVLQNMFCKICSAKCVREMCSGKCSTKCVPQNVTQNVFQEMCSMKCSTKCVL